MNTLNSLYASLNSVVAPFYGVPISQTIRRTLWVIPLASTIHILAIAMICRPSS